MGVLIRIAVLGVHSLVADPGNNRVRTARNSRSKEWAEPVDPVVFCESNDDRGPEASCGVQTTTSVVHAANLCDEKCETNVHWLSWSSIQHENGQYQLRCDKRLEEKTSCNRDGGLQGSRDDQRTRKKSFHKASGRDTGDDLSDNGLNCAVPMNLSREKQRRCYLVKLLAIVVQR